MFENIIVDEKRSVLTEIADRFYNMERNKEYGGERLQEIYTDVRETYGCKYVGQGQSRLVMELADEFVDGNGRFVVKFPLSPVDNDLWQDGLHQNETELTHWANMPPELCQHVTPIYDSHTAEKWIVMPYARPVRKRAYAYELKIYFEEHGYPLDVDLLENIGWLTTDDVTRLVAIDYGA